MALNSRPRSRLWSRLHFLLRLLGLSGLAACGIGGFLAVLAFGLDSREKILTAIGNWLKGQPTGSSVETVSLGLLVCGAAVTVLWLVVEMLVVSRTVAGRRSALGLTVLFQIALAALLLVGVNYYSLHHYLRLDWTSDQRFTLPETIREELAQLKGKTKIVVYLRRNEPEFGHKRNAYDHAAEQKIVEKVQDLVDLFRELGPRFEVEVLDVNERVDWGSESKTAESTGRERGYQAKLAKLPKPLRDALDQTTENCIFFYNPDSQTDVQIQRLSLSDFYRLDRERSRKESNLVLLSQGPEPFTRKVLNLDEKKPRVGVLVIHPYLAAKKGHKQIGLGGLEKTLTAHGFDVRDVILKKWSQIAPPEPGAYTYEESRLESLEERLTELDADIRLYEANLKEIDQVQTEWKTANLETLKKKYAARLRVRTITEPMRQLFLEDLEVNRAFIQLVLDQHRQAREVAAREKAGLNVDLSTEQRRITDVRAKLARLIDDCDLLLIPRLTLMDVASGERISNRHYRLDQEQVAAIKEFLKQKHKPVLVCFGPTNEPTDALMNGLGPTGPDDLERMLEETGFRFGKQTILFDDERAAFSEQRVSFFSSAEIKIPPVEFDWKPSEVRPWDKLTEQTGHDQGPNPIRLGMQFFGRDLELSLRHPRPVYFDEKLSRTLPFDPIFMVTNPRGWNEDQPFPTRDRTPRYEPKKDDPNRGTPDEKRYGRFPIGVAVETTLPTSWYEGKQQPGIVRLAAIGHGGLFTGNELTPSQEKLLLNTCNWLLGRDELLPRTDLPVWSYPRVRLAEDAGQANNLRWQWGLGMVIGLPAFFAYIGLIVLMFRMLR